MVMKAAEFQQEAQELVRLISLYKSLRLQQIYRFFPEKETVVRGLLKRVVKQRRGIYDPKSERVYANEKSAAAINRERDAALWVLLDFLDKVDYHTSSDYPVQICFFSDGEQYDIIAVPEGKERLIEQMINTVKLASSRIIIVDSPSQIPKIQITGVRGYCTVSGEGEIRYYKQE